MSDLSAGRKLTFTILHTNDLHSNLIGVAPSSDYRPDMVNQDETRGGYARLAALLAERTRACGELGPVLVLDGGDYSMQTAFGAAIRETGGAELQLMSQMGYDATTFGNHEFDAGPDALAESIGKAHRAGRTPAVLASNTVCAGSDPSLAGMQHLEEIGVICRHVAIERGGIRFGLFGVIGEEATFFTAGKGGVTFSDAVEAAKEIVKVLRDTEKVDVVIALSHGGLVQNADGTYTSGDDVTLAERVPGIDVVVGGHSHTELGVPIIVNGRTAVLQSGRYGRNVGQLVATLAANRLTVESYSLIPVDATILGDPSITEEIDRYKTIVTESVFASRGYAIDQPLVVVPRDLPNTFTDIVAMTPLANFVTDAARAATGADVALTANGTVREGLAKGRSGVQTVYDVFALASLGVGVVDQTAGSALVTAYFTGEEIKHMLEFMLVDNPSHPGEFFPRTSGMRFRYDSSRRQFDVVTAIEIGDVDHGYTPIDISGGDGRLYSVTAPLYVGALLLTIPPPPKARCPLSPRINTATPSPHGWKPSRFPEPALPTCCHRPTPSIRPAWPQPPRTAPSARSKNGRPLWTT